MRILLTLFLLYSGALQADAAFDSQASVATWITHYYRNPEPSKVPAAIRSMSEFGMLDNNAGLPPVFGFLAGVFRDNPDQVSGWLEETRDLAESHIGVVVLGLWYADLPNSQAQSYAILDQHPDLKQEFSFLLTGSPMSVDEIPLEQGPWVLDALWGNFMATGSEVPVLRIAEALPWLDVKGDIGRLVVGGAARWSLTSNAVQHPRVLQICEQSVGGQPTEVAARLREVIASAKAELEGAHAKQSEPTP